MTNCPFCGEIKSNADWFKCGTSIYSPEYHRSDSCKDRQIAQLTEIRDAWREYYGAWQAYREDISTDRLAKVIHKLSALGEI